MTDAVAITLATPARVPALAALLGRAFVTEPMLVWSMGGDSADLAERLAEEFRLLDERLVHHGMVWEAGAGLGVAAWIPPGQLGPVWEATAASSEQVHALTADGGARREAMWEWVEAQLPDEPIWFLDHIAVDPDRQGQGVGTALMEFGLARARADGSPAFLETGTARNVPYYERFGFRVVHEGDAPGGGPHIWFMRCDGPPAGG